MRHRMTLHESLQCKSARAALPRSSNSNWHCTAAPTSAISYERHDSCCPHSDCARIPRASPSRTALRSRHASIAAVSDRVRGISAPRLSYRIHREMPFSNSNCQCLWCSMVHALPVACSSHISEMHNNTTCTTRIVECTRIATSYGLKSSSVLQYLFCCLTDWHCVCWWYNDVHLNQRMICKYKREMAK